MFGMSIIEQLSVQIEMGMAVVSPPHAAVVVQVVVEFKQIVAHIQHVDVLVEEEEEPYLRVKCMFVRCPTSPFVPLYPTYRSCFKEFRPPIFLRNRYP